MPSLERRDDWLRRWRCALAIVLAVTLLVGPIGAAAHALELDAFDPVRGVETSQVPNDDGAERCCQGVVHTSKSGCHLDTVVLKSSFAQPGASATQIALRMNLAVPDGLDPSSPLDPPRPI